MARIPVIAGNWKMNLTADEGRALVEDLSTRIGAEAPCEVVVCPTALGVATAVQAANGSPIAVGAQNCHWEQSGAFTGEISAAQVKAAGASHVILGHSERRQLFGDHDELINLRLGAALAAGLVPILCIGETLEEREADELETVLRSQLTGALAGLSASLLSNLIVAYEPVWAIGTGKVASNAQAQEAHAFTRSVLAGVHGDDWAGGVRILYGGSVKPDNAAGLLAERDIDGALVGGASLKGESFAGIIDAVPAVAP